MGVRDPSEMMHAFALLDFSTFQAPTPTPARAGGVCFLECAELFFRRSTCLQERRQRGERRRQRREPSVTRGGRDGRREEALEAAETGAKRH